MANPNMKFRIAVMGATGSGKSTTQFINKASGSDLPVGDELVNEHKPIEKTVAGSELRRALDEQVENHKEDIRNLRVEMEAAMRAKDDETRGELQEELEKKKQQECMRIEQISQRMTAEFASERARLEARILQMEDVHQKHLQTLEGVQGEVARVLAEKEHHIRELEEERKARALAEESHQRHLQSLLEDVEKTRTAKEIADIAHAEEVQQGRERVAALETSQQRQSSTMEAAERECRGQERVKVLDAIMSSILAVLYPNGNETSTPVGPHLIYHETMSLDS